MRDIIILFTIRFTLYSSVILFSNIVFVLFFGYMKWDYGFEWEILLTLTALQIVGVGIAKMISYKIKETFNLKDNKDIDL